MFRAFARGAPLRIIGANFTGAGDLYWYVRSEFPIRSLKDTTEKNTISYSTNGASTHIVVSGFQKELGVKAVPTSTGGQTPTLTMVMSGQIDIGWASPPFGLKEVRKARSALLPMATTSPPSAIKACASRS